MGASPEDPQVDMYEFRKQAYPVAKDAIREVAPEAYGEMQSLMSSEIAALGDVDLQEVEQLLRVVDYINENPEEYPEVRAALISSGRIDAEDFPAEMDVEYFATMEVVLQEALMQKQGEMAQMAQGPVEMMPPQGFAKGGIAEAAQLVASKGRHGDTMLAHITPEEAKLLKARGGSGTINPETGLPEFFLKKMFKGIKKVVKKVLSSPVGRIVATVGLTMIGVPAPLASALVTKGAGGSWKDALKSAAVSYLGSPSSPIMGAVTKATPFLDNLSTATQAGIRSGLTATGAGLLTGSSLKDAATMGITSGLSSYLRAPSDTPAPVRDATVMTPDQIMGEAMDAAAAPAGGTGSMPFLGSTPQAMDAASAAPTAAQAPTAPGGFDLSNVMATSGGAAPGGFSDAAAGASNIGTGTNLSNVMQTGGTTGAGAPSSMFQQAKDFYNRNISPSGIREAGDLRAQEAGIKAVNDLVAANPSATDGMKTAAYTAAVKNATPGILGQYGPMVGLGIAGLGMAGGFEQKPLPESEFAGQMRQPIDVPEGLRTPMQNLPGVQYDAQGNIIGSQAWNPYSSTRPTEVATAGIMGAGSSPMFGTSPLYTPPPAAPGFGGPVSQPYNTASMYSPYLQPRRFNTGGVASLARGGYPRRIGKIEGPGTETSDDIPAMLSDGEFVMTARAVRGAGNGSRREGAKKMYAMMHQLEQNAARG
jgi:hypothetical protein